MEIEAKFRVRDEETFQRLLELDSLAGLRLAPVPPVDVGDRYYDTPDGALEAAGMACRVRSEGSRFFGTVKGVGHAEGAIHQRIEHEIELARPLSPAVWPAGEPRGLIERLSHGKPLQPLFDLEQRRHRRIAHKAGRAVADISLDRVVVRNAGRVLDRYLELEAEMLPEGSMADLERLAAHLGDEWGLQSEPSSKFERAIALLHPSKMDRERGSTHDRAALRLAEIEPDDLMSEAGRKVLGRQFQKMMTNEPGTRLGQDPEALHDMRVATRRMRAAFRVFGDYYHRNKIKSYEQGLKATGRALGPVRDLDVFMEKVKAYLDTLAPDAQGSLDRLWSILVERREVGRSQMLTYLDQDGYRQFKDEFALFCETEGMANRSLDMEAVEIKPYRVRDVAPAAIYERLAAVRAYDERVRSRRASLEQLHALRIACKRLRYTLEFFQPVLAPGAKTVIQEIVKMQDHLGAIQDVVVARELLQSLADEQGADLGIEEYLDYREAEMEQLLDSLPEVWARLHRSKFDGSLAQVVPIK